MGDEECSSRGSLDLQERSLRIEPAITIARFRAFPFWEIN